MSNTHSSNSFNKHQHQHNPLLTLILLLQYNLTKSTEFSTQKKKVLSLIKRISLFFYFFIFFICQKEYLFFSVLHYYKLNTIEI